MDGNHVFAKKASNASDIRDKIIQCPIKSDTGRSLKHPCMMHVRATMYFVVRHTKLSLSHLPSTSSKVAKNQFPH